MNKFLKLLIIIQLFISVGFSAESGLEALYFGVMSALALTLFFGVVKGLIYLFKYIFGIDDEPLTDEETAEFDKIFKKNNKKKI